MAKSKTRIPLGDAQGTSINNPFGALAQVKATNTAAPPATPPAPSEKKTSDTQRKLGKFAVQAERKGRGGKTVTLVRNLGLKTDALQDLAKSMKQALGCGASVEDDVLVLQGDQTERARDYLQKLRDA